MTKMETIPKSKKLKLQMSLIIHSMKRIGSEVFVMDPWTLRTCQRGPMTRIGDDQKFHSDFKKTKHHDVSVLKLKNRIRYGEHIQPACMAHVGWRIPEGFMCVVSGFGQTTSSGASGEVQIFMEIEKKSYESYDMTHMI